MISFVNYLIESGISLSLFSAVYFLLLRRETFFRVNRWYLLVSVVFSVVLPLLHIPVYAAQPVMLNEITVTPYANLLSTVTIYSSGLTHETEAFVLSYSIFAYVYLAGVAFFGIRLMIQLLQIYRLIRNSRVVKEGRISLVIIDRKLSPFSFLNYIFISENLHETKGWENMLEHERQHIQQGHTFDVLALELILVVQWFNPFFWLFRRALRENHEFLADRAVLAAGARPSWYKQMLINQYVGDQIVLANNFNYSLIKTRIKMMSKIRSKKIANVKILSGILLAACLVVVFAFDQDAAAQNQQPSAQGKTIFVDGKKVQLSGDAAAIEKLLQVVSESNNFELKSNETLGEITLIPKTNAMGETVVVAYGPKNSQPASKDDVFFIVEEMPEFPGGDLAMRNFIAQSVKYPVSAQEKKIQGKVFVNFIVDRDGSIGDAKIVRSVDPALDSEALRVVNSLPKWKPGKQKGVAVRVSYTVPINFVLQ